MKSPLGNLLLSAVLIAVPAGGFAFAEMAISPAVSASSVQASDAQGLGDLSPYKSIVSDTQRIAASGDLVAAERRITDLESLWDDNATALRQADRTAWSAIDGAADDALAALRARAPEPVRVKTALAILQSTLDNPVPQAATQPLRTVAGIAVTDETGRALPCEELIGKLRTALSGTTPSAAVSTLQTEALERCNADDDARADALAAEALAQIKG